MPGILFRPAMPQVSKEQIVDVIEDMGRLLELKGENVFKIRAYTNAARALETHTGDFRKAIAEGTLTEIPGIGKALADKITEFHHTGVIAAFEELRAEFPAGLFEIFELQGLGPKKIKILWEQLGVTCIAELKTAIEEGRLAELAGFGKKTAENMLKAIEDRTKHAGAFRFGDISAGAELLLNELKELPDVSQASIAG